MINSELLSPPAPPDAGQPASHDLVLRLEQLEAESTLLQQENKNLRTLLERVIEQRQKSHSELVLILTSLVSKLPINDIGVIVSRLVEHNANVTHALAALSKGIVEADLVQPEVLKTLDHTKRELHAALKPLVEELIALDTPLEPEALRCLADKPELFFSPAIVRATRCFIKGQVARDRVVKEFGAPALVAFNDLTTDPKLNPRPKPEEIVLAFKPEFEALLQQNPDLVPNKRQDLLALYQRVQRSKAATPDARAQKIAFQKLSFIIDLLYFYEHQNTEAPDVIFAQRLPVLIEQLVLSGPQEDLDEKLIAFAEGLLAHIINPDHRHMVINNIGKGGGAAKTLKYVLKLRADRVPDADQVAVEFLKHLIPPGQKTPSAESLTPVLRLVPSAMQRQVIKAILGSDRLRKTEAETLGRGLAVSLGHKDLEQARAVEAVPVEVERQMAWNKVKDMISRRSDAATLAATIRERLNAKYDADEIRQSWITLTEADPMSLIRVFCHLPYLPNGSTDPIARTVIETYVSRLTHERYTSTYQKVVTSLRNMYRAKADSPTLVTFMALVKWASPDAAAHISADIGIPAATASH